MTRMGTHVRGMAVCAIAVALVVVAARDPVAAQRGPEAGPRPGWLPGYYASQLDADLTAAQRTAARRVLDEIERILVQVPELASPKGFEVRRQFGGGTPMLGPGGVTLPNSVVTLAFTLWFFAPTQAIAGEGCTCIQVQVNFEDIWNVADSPQGGYADDQGRKIFVEPPRGEKAPFTTEAYYQLVPQQSSMVAAVLTSGGEPYARPVTREQFYNAVLLDLEGKDRSTLAETRTKLEKTPYQVWMDGAAERKKEREETLKAMAAIQPPGEVAKMRKMLEDTEREVTENLRASDADDRQRNKEGLGQLVALGDNIRAELKAMTPAQRNMPAITDPAGGDGLNATGMTVVERDSPAMRRVLMPNYDLWRARKSPVEVRSIVVKIRGTGTGLVPAVNNALVQTYRKLDWAALNKLLDVPR